MSEEAKTTQSTSETSQESSVKEKSAAAPQSTEESDSGWFESLTVTPEPKESKPESAKAPAPKAEGKPEESKSASEKPDAATEKPAEKSTKPEEKAAPKAEADPERAKLEKQVKDTRDAFTQERQRNVELTRQMSALTEQMKILAQKVDGTYEEPPAPDPNVVAEQAAVSARVEASHHAAIEKVMFEENLSRDDATAKVMEIVWNPDSPYQMIEANDPAAKARVLGSKTPVLEALNVVKEYQTKQKATEPVNEQALREQITKEITEKVRKELKEKKTFEDVPSVKGGSSRTPNPENADAAQPDNFSELFPNFAS